MSKPPPKPPLCSLLHQSWWHPTLGLLLESTQAWMRGGCCCTACRQLFGHWIFGRPAS
jgi:hypothetical protein